MTNQIKLNIIEVAKEKTTKELKQNMASTTTDEKLKAEVEILKSKLASLEAEKNAKIAQIEAECNARIAQLDAERNTKVAQVEAERNAIQAQYNELVSQFENIRTDAQKTAEKLVVYRNALIALANEIQIG